MKKYVVIAAAVCMAIGAKAQKLKDTDVPDAVKDSFKKSHPAATVKKWEKEKENYEAEFMTGKTETSVLMDATGKLLETETEISVDQLPKAVNDYIAKNLPGKKIKEASKITDAKNTVTYEAEIAEADYIFDANGSFLKKEVEDND